MEKNFTIKEIAQFFQINASALRYWEEAGILSPSKNSENNYREYRIDDILTISDVLFYKNLGLPLKQIASMEHTSADDHQQLLEDKIVELNKQKNEIDHQIQKLHYHLEAISCMKELKKHPFRMSDIDMDSVVSFSFSESDKLKQYIENPYLLTRVQESSDITKMKRGLCISKDCAFDTTALLWQKKSNRYIVCLMRQKMTPDYSNNLALLLEEVQKTYKTGIILSRFLLQAQENGTVYDFYKTYIEIID